MAVSAIPASQTGPSVRASNSTKALRQRLETVERNVSRLQANRTPSPLLLHQLANAPKMSKVADQEVPIYDASSGQYIPGLLDKIQNGSSYIQITSGSDIQVFGGGCGPNTIEGATWEITAQFEFLSIVDFTGFPRFIDAELSMEFSGNQWSITGLPTADPHEVGSVWNNSGVVTISHG